MKPLSQRDKRWKNIKLGWSNNTTIGSHGCLITSLAMLWDTTPDKVNEWLKNNNGYANLNLVVWTKISGFEWRGWTYDNNKVKETIKKYGACIVETDFNTNPKDGSHFVVFVGNGKLYDPWTGREKSTSSFPVYYGYAVINPEKNPLKGGSMSKELEECMKDRKRFWKERDEVLKKLKEKQKVISSQASELTEIKKVKKELINEVDEMEEKNKKVEELREKWHKLYQQSQKNFKSCQLDLTVFKKKLTEMKNLREPRRKLLKKIFYFALEVDTMLDKLSKRA